MWLIDVAMGFALGYLFAFLKYKKGVWSFIKSREFEKNGNRKLINIKEIRKKARRKS